MKRFLAVLFVTFLFTGGFLMQSCNKCAVCQYTYTGPLGQTETYSYSEVCGNNNDVNDYKDACEAAAALYTNGNCTCEDE